MKVKEESKKVGLALSILKTKIMAFSPNTSWKTGKNGKSGRFYFLFFFFKNLFNWRLITLYIIVVFDIHWHESAMGVHVLSILISLPPSSPSHPSGLSQCTGFECPVSYIELGLFIYFTYGDINDSMLFSQIILPLPSPTESKSLFFTSVSFLSFAYRIVITIFLNSIYIC